jgi:AraC-like DNA-binding protein
VTKWEDLSTTPRKVDDGLIPYISQVLFRKCTPSWRMVSKGELDIWDLTYIIEGAAQYTVDGVNYDVSAGDLWCLPPGHIREARTFSDKLMHCFAINLSVRDLDGKTTYLPFPLVTHIGVRKDLIHLYHDLVFSWIDKQPLYKIKARAIVLLILHRLCELSMYKGSSGRKDFRVQKVIGYISTHFAERILVKEMADMVGLNEVYFGVLFRQETGMSMNQYVNKFRIQQAEDLLRNANASVEEAAELCGYSDVIHFYRHFKNLRGYPPSECFPKNRVI